MARFGLTKLRQWKQIYLLLSAVYREVVMELPMTTETKNFQHESYVKRCAEATHERKFLTMDRVR
jgi:hypothetical protein